MSRKTPVSNQQELAERIMREDHALLRALADHDRAGEIELQLEAAGNLMRDRREAFKALADHDKGLSEPD